MGVLGKSSSEWSIHPGVIPFQPSEYALGLGDTNSCCGHGADGTLGMGTRISEKGGKSVSTEAGSSELYYPCPLA